MKSKQLLQVLVACTFASSVLPAAADASDDWVAYRKANGLAIYPAPSLPGELPTFEGPVPDTRQSPVMVAGNGSGNGNGNGNGHGSSHDDAAFMAELAKGDGE